MPALPPTEPGIDVHGYLLRPHHEWLWRQAMALMRSGDPAAAYRCMAQLCTEQPDFLPARVQAAFFLLGVDRYCDALAVAREIADCKPRTVDFALYAIRLLRRFEEHERIALLFERVDWEACISVDLLTQVAGELGPIGLYRQTAALLERADRLAHGDRRVQTLRGTIDFIAGDVEGSRRSLRAALASPGHDIPHARWMLTMQPELDRIDQDIAAVSESLRNVAPGTEDEAYLAFGLHNLLHAASRYDESWQALERGCRVKRGLIRYDGQRQRDLFNALLSTPLNGMSVAGRSGMPRAIFIVGMHRSGTSVLERILAGHSDVADGGESYVFTAAMREATDHLCPGVVDEVVIRRAPDVDLALAGRRFQEYARWRAKGRPCFTEKLPSNFLNLGFILRSMPDACVLHMRRDPMDTCFSNLRTFFSRAAPYSYDQNELADYFGMYQNLMHHWDRHFPGRILDIDYQTLVEEPESQTARVMSFCGLRFRPEALDVSRNSGYSATASIGSVRKGILKDRGGAWKPYRAYLAPLLRTLRNVEAIEADRG